LFSISLLKVSCKLDSNMRLKKPKTKHFSEESPPFSTKTVPSFLKARTYMPGIAEISYAEVNKICSNLMIRSVILIVSNC